MTAVDGSESRLPALQVGMLNGLANIYGVNQDERSGQVFVTALTGSSLAKLGASAIKALPGVGTLLGGLSMSAMSGASTYALGQVAVTQLETHGTIEGMDINAARAQYGSALERGKAVVTELEKKRESDSGDPSERLRKLQALFEAGLIEQEEYDEQRARVLTEI